MGKTAKEDDMVGPLDDDEYPRTRRNLRYPRSRQHKTPKAAPAVASGAGPKAPAEDPQQQSQLADPELAARVLHQSE